MLKESVVQVSLKSLGKHNSGSCPLNRECEVKSFARLNLLRILWSQVDLYDLQEGRLSTAIECEISIYLYLIYIYVYIIYRLTYCYTDLWTSLPYHPETFSEFCQNYVSERARFSVATAITHRSGSRQMTSTSTVRRFAVYCFLSRNFGNTWSFLLGEGRSMFLTTSIIYIAKFRSSHAWWFLMWHYSPWGSLCSHYNWCRSSYESRCDLQELLWSPQVGDQQSPRLVIRPQTVHTCTSIVAFLIYQISMSSKHQISTTWHKQYAGLSLYLRSERTQGVYEHQDCSHLAMDSTTATNSLELRSQCGTVVSCSDCSAFVDSLKIFDLGKNSDKNLWHALQKSEIFTLGQSITS